MIVVLVFCACSFVDKIYLFGGYNTGYNKCSTLTSSLQFDPNGAGNNKWKEVVRMNQKRYHASCVAFEGKIVVSGGNNVYNFGRKKQLNYMTS